MNDEPVGRKISAGLFLSFFLQLPELSSQKALRNIKGDAPEMNGNEKKELPSAECALHKNL